MDDLPKNDPAFAFAVYAATAATAAVTSLRKAGLMRQDNVDDLVRNLTICRQRAGNDARLIEVAELLTDMLMDQSKA